MIHRLMYTKVYDAEEWIPYQFSNDFVYMALSKQVIIRIMKIKWRWDEQGVIFIRKKLGTAQEEVHKLTNKFNQGNI